MTVKKKARVAFLGLFLAIASQAAVPYPPLLTPQQHERYILDLTQQYPWLTPLGISPHLPQYLQLQQAWLGQLYQSRQFRELNRQRPDLLSIHVQSLTQEKRNIKTISSRETRERIVELQAYFGTRGAPKFEANAIETQLKELLPRLQDSNSRTFLIGLIHCLPPRERAALFELADPETQIEQLAQHPDFTDERILEEFHPESHGLTSQAVTRESLLRHAQALIEGESQIVNLLRARWLIEVADREPQRWAFPLKGLNNYLSEASSLAFNPFEEGVDDIRQDFLKQLRLRLGVTPKDLDRIFKNLKARQVSQEMRTVKVGKDLFTLQEVPPEIGAYRGVVGGDCSLGAYAFPFSPLERVYFIFVNENPLRAYVSGTIVKVDQKLTLYVHDLAGPMMTPELETEILHALYLARADIGVEALSIATKHMQEKNAAEEPSQSSRIQALLKELNRYAKKERIEHEYLDTEVRNFLGSQPSSNLEYDSPEVNANGHWVVPSQNQLDGLTVIIEGNASEPIEKMGEEVPPKREAFLQLIDLNSAGNAETGFAEELGFERREADKIVALLKNKKHLPLKDYYEALTQLFAEYEVELSENFIKKHVQYFVEGHLKASNATTTRDSQLSDRTLKFTIQTIRRGIERSFAYKLVASDPDFFNRSEEFRAYVASIPLRGPEHLERVRLLLQSGVDTSLFVESPQRAQQAADSGLKELQRLAVGWRNQAAPVEETVSPERLRKWATDLDNEHHESDEASLKAVKALMEHRTQDVNVNRSLMESIKKEDNIEIAYRAAIALLRNGGEHPRAIKILEKYAQDQELGANLRKQGNALLAAIADGQCQQIKKLGGNNR